MPSPHPNPNRRPSRAGTGRLEANVLRHLRLGIAVIDANIRVLYSNQRAARLFGFPPAMAAEMPALADVLSNAATLSPAQRNRIVAFATVRTHAGAPGGRLRLSMNRERRITIQVRGMGRGQWMLIAEDGKASSAQTPALAQSGPRQPAKRAVMAAPNAGDAWLDTLTGLGNRRQFDQVLRQTLAAATPDARHAILLIDLDRFAAINDTLGHSIGDALLCRVAQRLRRDTRDEDLVVRLGGDEFAILIQDATHADAVAARVVETLSRPFLVAGQIATTGASLGIVRFPEHAATADELMRHAEVALYEAKSAGRHTWREFEPTMAARVRTRRAFETDLRRALALDEFSVEYQPRLDIRTQTLAGFEALPRWNHATRGQVPPNVFIPLAEDIGCLAQLHEWVLNAACQQASHWPARFFVAVKVSAGRFQNGECLFDAVEQALQSSGLAPERLELEITDSAGKGVLETLNRLRDRGIRIAGDECGYGNTGVRGCPAGRPVPPSAIDALPRHYGPNANKFPVSV